MERRQPKWKRETGILKDQVWEMQDTYATDSSSQPNVDTVVSLESVESEWPKKDGVDGKRADALDQFDTDEDDQDKVVPETPLPFGISSAIMTLQLGEVS